VSPALARDRDEPFIATACFDLGSRAYFELRPLESNPFPAGGERAWAWDLGWRFADSTVKEAVRR
jgi:hypothetical protein